MNLKTAGCFMPVRHDGLLFILSNLAGCGWFVECVIMDALFVYFEKADPLDFLVSNYFSLFF